MTGAPGSHCLGQDHPGERLGVLLDESAGQGHRCHRAGQGERRDAHDLVVRRELHDPLEHRRIEPKRRARVDDGEDRRLAIDRRRVDATGDADHLQDIDVALAAEAVAVDRLVHQGQRVVAGPQVADAVVEVDRLDRVAGQEVDGVERLPEPQQVLVVGAVADPPAAVEIRDVRRAADGAEGYPVAAELDVVGGIARVEE